MFTPDFYFGMNISLSVLGVLAVVWMLFNRQYATVCLAVGIVFVCWINTPADNIALLVLSDVPGRISHKDFTASRDKLINRIINNKADMDDLYLISNLYTIRGDTLAYELKSPVPDNDKMRIVAIFKSPGYNPGSDSPFPVTFWIPASLEPGTSIPVAMSIRLKEAGNADITYRLFAQHNQCILISDNITAKNLKAEPEYTGSNKAYATNLLFEGALNKDNSEIISKKVTLECLKASQAVTTLTFSLEKQTADKKWVEEQWRRTEFTIKITNKVFSDLKEISFLLGFAGAVIVVLFQFIDALKKQKQGN